MCQTTYFVIYVPIFLFINKTGMSRLKKKKDNLLDVANTVTNRQIPQNSEKFFISRETITFSRNNVLHEVG